MVGCSAGSRRRAALTSPPGPAWPVVADAADTVARCAAAWSGLALAAKGEETVEVRGQRCAQVAARLPALEAAAVEALESAAVALGARA